MLSADRDSFIQKFCCVCCTNGVPLCCYSNSVIEDEEHCFWDGRRRFDDGLCISSIAASLSILVARNYLELPLSRSRGFLSDSTGCKGKRFLALTWGVKNVIRFAWVFYYSLDGVWAASAFWHLSELLLSRASWRQSYLLISGVTRGSTGLILSSFDWGWL